MRKEGFLAFLVFLFLMSPFSMANALTVKLDPASVDLPAPGNTFNINVLIENVTDLGGFQFDIKYNPAIVTVANASDVTLGSFLGSTGRTATPVGPAIDNVTGKVTFGAFSFGANPGPNGNGVLATIKFTVQSQINGVLDLNNVQVTDTAANVLTVDTVGDATLNIIIITVPDITVTDSVSPVDDLRVPFGDITVGNSSNQTITITNGGNANLVIGNIAQANPLGGPFSILNDNCSGRTIAPAGTCNLGVSFSPATTGPFTDTFDIPSNDPDENPVTVNVSGNGLSAITNNPPSAPELIFPANDQTGLGTTVTFRWKRSSDPDGDTVKYKLFVDTDPSFTGTTPIEVTSLKSKNIYFAGMGGSILLLLGIAITGSISSIKRRRMMLWLKTIIIIIAGMFLFSCGGGNGGGNGNQITYTVSGLNSNTAYFWKVVADDEKGGTTPSETRSFTTQ